ncbi:MAG: NUDIX domain-containing protein [Halobacteriovoraceae bacterium]|nr:NUDIX domain-containing protein [Halobacteriovoraceae bacterium]MBT5096000.1 NUDIX domain-containing protein [Halobacteriovoraceae bacterium]
MEKAVYSGKFVRVTEEDIEGALYERAYIKNAVIVFAVTDDQKILLIREKRPHERHGVRLKPVTGFFEDHLSWEENCQQELQEELGYKAESLERFLFLDHQGSIYVQKHFVLAKGLVASKLPNPDGEDVIVGTLEVGLDELIELALTPEMPMVMDHLGIFTLWHKIQRGELSLGRD